MWWTGFESMTGGYGSYGVGGSAAAAMDADAKAQRAHTEIAFLAQDVERLFMVTEALWQILKKEHGYDDEELRRRITAIDQRKSPPAHAGAKQEPLPCPKCGHTLSRRHARCIFCGADAAREPFAR